MISYLKIMMIVICVVVFVIFLFLFLNSYYVKCLFEKIYNRISNHHTNRKRTVHMNEMTNGSVDEKGLLNKIDSVLVSSGFREKYSYISSELLILSDLCAAIFCGLIICFFFGNKLSFFIVLGGFIVFPCIVLYFLQGSRYLKTERQLMIFINLLENYSKTSDDLVDIISKTETYVDEPLKSAIRKFSWEAKHVGELDEAILHLKEKIPHRKFQEILQNLDICRKHDTNYEEVISDIRISMQQYLKSKEEKKSIRQSSRGNVIIMLLVGVFIIKLVDGFVEGGLIALLCGNILGGIILIYIIFVVLAGVWQLVKIDRN